MATESALAAGNSSPAVAGSTRRTSASSVAVSTVIHRSASQTQGAPSTAPAAISATGASVAMVKNSIGIAASPASSGPAFGHRQQSRRTDDWQGARSTAPAPRPGGAEWRPREDSNPQPAA